MGLVKENNARKFGNSREHADQFAVDSHRKAVAAIAADKFKDETVAVEVKITSLPNGNGVENKGPAKAPTQTFLFDRDEMARAETLMEVAAGLRPACHFKGTVTERDS